MRTIEDRVKIAALRANEYAEIKINLGMLKLEDVMIDDKIKELKSSGVTVEEIITFTVAYWEKIIPVYAKTILPKYITSDNITFHIYSNYYSLMDLLKDTYKKEQAYRELIVKPLQKGYPIFYETMDLIIKTNIALLGETPSNPNKIETTRNQETITANKEVKYKEVNRDTKDTEVTINNKIINIAEWKTK